MDNKLAVGNATDKHSGFMESSGCFPVIKKHENHVHFLQNRGMSSWEGWALFGGHCWHCMSATGNDNADIKKPAVYIFLELRHLMELA